MKGNGRQQAAHRIRRNAFRLAQRACLGLALIILAPNAFGQGWNVDLVGQIGGECNAVCIVGTRAYVGEGPGLRILDISNPAVPVSFGHLVLGDTVRAIAVSGSLAYVGCDLPTGLQIVNVADATSPTVGGAYSAVAPRDIVLSGSLAYVVGDIVGCRFHILNVADPTSPTLRGAYSDVGNAYGVFVSGNRAYVASENRGLLVFDVSDTAQPRLLGSYQTSQFHAYDVQVVGALAYVAGGSGGLQILNVSASTPTLVCAYRMPDPAWDDAWAVQYVSGLVYLADGGKGLKIVNVTNPTSPTLRGTYDTPGRAVGVQVSGSSAYVADGGGGFQIINVANPSLPTLRGAYDVVDHGLNLFLSGGVAYVAGYEDRLQIIDVSNPTRPRTLSAYSDWVQDIYVAGNLAYLATFHGLRIVNVADPSSPTLRGQYVIGEDVCFVSGDYAYLARNYTLIILDIHDPAHPVFRSSYPMPVGSAPSAVVVSNNLAYVTCSYVGGGPNKGGLQIINVANPSSPTLRASYPIPTMGAYDVYLQDTLAYVACGGKGLKILDVSNPSSPFLIGSCDVSGAWGVYVSGDVAYVAGGAGLEVVNVANPTQPKHFGSYDTRGVGQAVFASGGLAYLANKDNGLWVLRYVPPVPPAAPTSLTATAISTSEIHLAWRDNLKNEEGFKIERKTGSSGAWSEIASVGPNVATYDDSGLWSGTDYCYRVKAFNVAGESPYSNEAWAKTQGVALAIISGHVFNQETGEPLADATVQVGTNSLATDAQGRYLRGQLPPATVTVTVSKTGFYTVRRQVTLTAGTTVVENFGLRPLEPGAKPVVYSVTSKYCWPGKFIYFLDGVDLYVEFTADVEWNGTPGVVRFITPKGTFEQSGLKRTFNVGRDFGPNGSMTVVARNGAGQLSDPYSVDFRVISGPPGISLLGARLTTTDRDISYSITIGAELIQIGVGDGTISASIPLVGGKAFKIVKSMQLTLEFSSQGTASVDFEMEVPTPGEGIKLGAAEVTPKVKIHVGWTYDRDQDDWDTTGYFELGADAELKLPPTPPYCVYLFTLGPVPIYLRGEVSVGLAARMEVNGWDASGPDLNGVLIFSPGLTGFLGAGVAEVLAIEGYLGGTLNLEGQWPQTPMLRKCSLLFTGGVRVVVWIFEYSKDLFTYEWDLYEADSGLPGTSVHWPTLQGFPPDRFELMSRRYLENAPYAAFVANVAPLEAVSREPGKTAVVAQRIEQNIFPFSQPAVATAGGNTLLVWVHDDPTRSSANRTELVFSRFNGSVWTTPAPVADNNTADFSPALAGLPDGTFLAVWNDVKQVFTTTPTLSQMASKMEIAAARYRPATGLWDAPVRLSNSNDALDHTPHVASAPDGTALATWIYNPANDTIGSATATNNIYCSRWNGSAWGPMGSVRMGLGAIVKTSLAYKNGAGALVYSTDADGNLTTENDQELYAVSWNGSAWAAPTRLTNNTVRDAAPQAIYDSAGNLVIAWLQGDRIVTARGLTLQNQRTAVVCGRTEGAGDFRLARDPTTSGPLVLFWTDTSAQGHDIWTATYDGVNDSWGAAAQLTADDSMERSLAPTFRSAGQWLLAYDRVRTVYTTQTVVVNGKPVKVPNVPGAGPTDLYVARYTIGGDLAIRANEISIVPPNPNPTSGSVISAMIWNLGDLAVRNVEVAFYDGDPASGGSQIGATRVITNQIAAGTSATVTANWTVPAGTAAHRICVVVDPARKQNDRDRANNTAFLDAVRPDLTVREFFAEAVGPNRLTFTIRVANDGAAASSPTTVRIYLEKDGRVRLYDGTIPRLNAGAGCDIGYLWDIGLNRGTFNVRAIVDETNTVSESNELNNEAVIRVFGLNPTSSKMWRVYP